MRVYGLGFFEKALLNRTYTFDKGSKWDIPHIADNNIKAKWSNREYWSIIYRFLQVLGFDFLPWKYLHFPNLIPLFPRVKFFLIYQIFIIFTVFTKCLHELSVTFLLALWPSFLFFCLSRNCPFLIFLCLVIFLLNNIDLNSFIFDFMLLG